MTNGARRIPDSLLERYLADALDALARARLEATLASSPEDQARLDELRADSAAFLIQHPPEPLVERFRQERQRARWWRWPALFISVLAVAAVALVTLLPPVPDFTIKGSAILVLHRKVGESSQVVSPEVPVAAGDSIRFEVKSPESGYVAVVGRDAKGVVTVYYPYGGTTAERYDAGQTVLPGAIILDDTLGREDLFVLHSTRPFGLEWALRALETGQPLKEAAPQGVSVGSTFLTKK
jgi:hypothetical protein